MGTERSDSQPNDDFTCAPVDDVIRRLYAYAYRLTGSHHGAEELVQQTFLIAEQRKHQLRDETKLIPWLMRILRNGFLQDVRRLRPSAASQVELDLEQIEGESSVGSLQSEHLQEALEQLNPEHRRVLLMFYFESWSYKEIAEQLEIPVGTVMSRLSRAKRQLKQLLLVEQLDRIGQGWDSL